MPLQGISIHSSSVAPERTIQAGPFAEEGPRRRFETAWARRLATTTFLAVFVLTAAPWANAAPRRTSFDPGTHGFRFNNTFRNDVIREVDFRTDGLCGGMVYTALDYYRAGRDIPTQSYRPAVHHPLHDYIYDRQVTSIVDNLDKWIELGAGFNWLGARDSEFFHWGLQGFGGGRLEELRHEIDRGRPVPLGLQEYGDGSAGNHQVLAIGYDLGRYRGDLKAHRGDLKIFVYDPNHRGRTMTLVPDLGRQAYHYLETPGRRWRTYFVDKKYRPKQPPAVAPEAPSPATAPVARELLLEIHTGGDDLRGGNDNVNVTVHYRGRPAETVTNVNRSRRWIDHYTQTVRIPLRERVPPEDLVAVVLTTTFSGGIAGDNWNVDRLRILVRGDGFSDRPVYSASGKPLVRFTGERKTFRAALR